MFCFPGVAVVEVDGGYVCLCKRFKRVFVHVFTVSGLVEVEGGSFWRPLALRRSFSQVYGGDSLRLLFSELAGLGVVEVEMWHGEVEVASPLRRGWVLRGVGGGYALKLRVGLGGVPGCAGRAVEAVKLLL